MRYDRRRAAAGRGGIVMPKTIQLVLGLESKPGVLAKLARTLADAGVNMTALCAPETAGRGKIRLLVSDLARAKEALKTGKYRFAERSEERRVGKECRSRWS